MKRKLYVPLMNCALNDDNRAVYLSELKRLDIDRVFIAFERESFFAEGVEREKYFSLLKTNVNFFQNNGYKVGVWFNAFGFGAPLGEKESETAKKYTPIRSVTAKQNQTNDAFCPEDSVFLNDYLRWVKEIATVKSDLLMLDDDLCLSVRPGIGCFCDKHLKLIEEELGEKVDVDGLYDKLFVGGANKIRKAWLKVVKSTMIKFASSVREAVNEVDSTIRIGFCAGFTSWDIEGIDALELAKVLAGNTKPFLRFTGAPYWAINGLNRFNGMPLSAIIEEARGQEYHSRNSGVETFIESDSYPRPRYIVSSSLIESFSLAMCANGGVDELGYFFDYHSSPEYERGYVDHREYNKNLYEFIENNFDDKKCVGIKVFNQMHKIENADLPKEVSELNIMTMHFNRGAEFLSVLGIPTTYEDDALCGIAFGEDARYITKPCKKMIVDIRAAEILTRRGYDVGLESLEKSSTPTFEWFGEEKIYLTLGTSDGYYNVKVKDVAKICSEFEVAGKKIPSAYIYSTGDVEYLVYTFDAQRIPHRAAVLRSYARGEQIRDYFNNFCYIKKASSIYQLCKKSHNETSILFINTGDNPIINGQILLDDDYVKMNIIGVDGVLDERKINLSSYVPPFGAFALVLEK